MINIFGFDVFNNIITYLVDYRDILSVKCVNKELFYYDYPNKELEVSISTDIDLHYLEKITIKSGSILGLPINVKICVLQDCSIQNTIDADNLEALHISDSYTFCNPLAFNQYDTLTAIYLYNFLIDPDDLLLPNLEYLCIFESDYDDSYVYMFNVERFPNLKYLDICKIYMDDDDAQVPMLEYYNGCFRNYNMPNLIYIEWETELLSEAQYIILFPKLTTIISNNEPKEPFTYLKVIKPEESNIAKNYYNKYFNLY